MVTWQNPSNVPTGGNATYMALAQVSARQLGYLNVLKRKAGNSPTWDEDCGRILGDGWDGDYSTLSQAAASWLISNLQRAFAAIEEDERV